MKNKDYTKLTDKELIDEENSLINEIERKVSSNENEKLGYSIYKKYEPKLKAIEREYQNRGLFNVPVDVGGLDALR